LKLFLKLFIAEQTKTSEKSSELILLICRQMRQFVFDLSDGHDGYLPKIEVSCKFQSPNVQLSCPERGLSVCRTRFSSAGVGAKLTRGY
jgi:hypothetical protein